jgi:copper chaperone CopZ
MNASNPKAIPMKTTLLAVVAASALVLSARSADTTVKLSNVHLCCPNCVKSVQTAVGKVPGATATGDRQAGTVTLTGPDTATVQKAADALVAAGYFGKSSDSAIKISDDTGAKGQKVESLKVEGVHLCCGKCVTAVDDALKSVSGVKSHTAVKNAKSFEVTGDFDDKEVFTALQKAGLSGQVGK